MVIFSCVRAHSRRSGVGFLSDVRRMNVGLTRARRSLWILGHSSTLQVPATQANSRWCCCVLMTRPMAEHVGRLYAWPAQVMCLPL